jgi:hypothetical protein
MAEVVASRPWTVPKEKNSLRSFFKREDIAMGRRQKPEPSETRIPNIEDDYIFLVQARTAHGLVATISVQPSAERATVDRDAFLATRNGSRYWTNKQGNIDIWIQTKPVIKDKPQCSR